MQYVSIKNTERLAEAGIEPSIGSVGDSWDNVLAATINGLYKAEVIHRRGPWRSLEAVEFATLEWVGRFDKPRLFEPIGNTPPAKAEAAYYVQLEMTRIAAQASDKIPSGNPGAVQSRSPRCARPGPSRHPAGTPPPPPWAPARCHPPKIGR